LVLLGGFAVRLEGHPTPRFRSQKARALLAYLAMDAERPHERAALAALYWPEMSDALALRNLSQTLIWLRRAIGEGAPPFLLLNQRQVQWNAAAAVEVDARRFLALLERSGAPSVADADAKREAVGLYAGEFLAGFSLSGCPAFDEWLLLQREYFQRLALEALFRLTGEALAAGEYAEAAALARRQLALDHWREEAIRQLLRALAAGGHAAEALAEYEKARRLLSEELGVEPQPETIQLAEEIRHGRGGKSSALPAPPSMPHNLPVRLTSLLGRESELAKLSGWLSAPETRLVTLTGSGGVGKTHLALAVASSFITQSSIVRPSPLSPQASVFPDGVWFVPLAGLGDGSAAVDKGEILVAAVAATLGLTSAEPESLYQVLERYLRDRCLLLVLDNFEQILSSRPTLLSLLQNAPGVRALITSRELLGLGGERRLMLEGLPTPPPEAAETQESLLAYSSPRLFFTRALERGEHLVLDEAERESLIRICCLAEGLPFVIELAAAWTGHFTCAEIAAEMAANLDFLSVDHAARVDLPARQRSPRAAFDYAWELLSPAEQRVLVQLALLPGAFSREAAMVVTEARLVDLLSLVNKSLLRQTSPGWYTLHSLVRQFALEQLQQMEAVEAAARERHAAYFLGFVAGCEMLWYGATPQRARADLRPVFENVRVAWQWAIQHNDFRLLDDALLGLIGYYRSEGLLTEAVNVIDQLATQLRPPETPGSIEARLLGRALAYQAALVGRRDLKADTALELAESAVAWAQRAADPVTKLLAAFSRGVALILSASLSRLPPGDLDQIRESLEQSIAFGRQVPATDSRELQRARVMEIQSLNMLGNYFLLRGERAEAMWHYEAGLALCRTWGNVLGEGQNCYTIGELLENEGDLEQALHYREQALRLYQLIDEPDSMSATLGDLCGVLTYLGDYPRALENGRAALQLRQQHGLVSHFLYYRSALAAYHLGDEAQALKLVTAALEETALSPYTFQFHLVAGECYTRLMRWGEATEALQLALSLALNGIDRLAAATVQRALADLALAQGDLAAALTHVEALLPVLGGAPLASSYEPLRIYWTCYRALKATDDPRASGILAAAHGLLQSQAALIQDAALRHTFLQQVAANREIAAEWLRVAG